MTPTIFGQIVVGPPGSGKSTYCKFICENLKQLGRNAKIINLDPANDCLPYKPAINVMDFVDVTNIMDKAKCGPNGAMIHCMDLLNENFGWLFDKIVDLIESENEKKKEFDKSEQQQFSSSNDQAGELVAGQGVDSLKMRPYLLFDCPGQSELYTHHTSVKDIIKQLGSSKTHFDLRLVCMNLCDSFHSSDLGKYISIVLNSLTTMLNLELPHVNVLSKVDIMEKHGQTRFNLDYYCEVVNLKYLLDTELDNPFFEKYKKMTRAIAEVIEDFSLVSFVPLNIQQAEDIRCVLLLADKANGYCCDDLDLSVLQMNPQLMEMASGRRLGSLRDATA